MRDKHSPGPWSIEEARRVLGAGDFGKKPMRDPEVEANARLIAAAPAMLAALRGLLAGLPPFNPDHHPMLADDARRARAAIAAATGGDDAS